jgi:homoserine kinase type II
VQIVDVVALLKRYAPDCRANQIESLRSAGGMSGAQFWRVHAPRGLLCLRRWPKEHPSPDRLDFIHSVLRHAERQGVDFLPLPIAAENGATYAEHSGHLWELSRWLPGTADYIDAPSNAKLKAAMKALAKFHVATADVQVPAGAPSAVAKRLFRLQELTQGSLKVLSQAIDPLVWPELVPLARQFLASLQSALPRAIEMLRPLQGVSLPLQPCIRDIWHDHVLFTNNLVTGIVDFGAVDIDTPACDVARLLGSLVDDDPGGWQTGLAAYSKHRPPSADESAAVRALDASGTLLAGCNWIRWIYIEGREFENPKQVVERFRRILSRTSNLASIK